MRTTSWYSSLPNRARPLPSIFCTGGHDRPTPYAAVHRCTRNPAPSRSVRNCSSPLLRLPVVFGDTFRIPMQACAQLRGRLPLPALVPQHESEIPDAARSSAPISVACVARSREIFSQRLRHHVMDQRQPPPVRTNPIPGAAFAEPATRQTVRAPAPTTPGCCFFLPRTHSRHQPHPPPHVPLSTRRLSNSDGAAGGSTPTPRPSPASPVRSTQFRTRRLLQHPQIIHPVGRHVMRAHCLRMPNPEMYQP